MPKKVSEKDKRDWEDFLKSPSKIFDKENFITEKKQSKIYKFDLHGFSILEANKKVREIIESCYSKKYSDILIITGKGYHSKSDENVYVSKEYSKLKSTVPEFINNDPELSQKIIQVKEAEEKMGGKGAILIKLKKSKE